MPITKTQRPVHGFETYTLKSQAVEIAVVPELGARIVSLKNRRTGREWMWHPGEELRLFRNRVGDDFSRSTLAGADECLPTVAPCAWQGRELPDHGEVWSVPWEVDELEWRRGVLRTTVRLAVSPFEFERKVEIDGNAVRLSYGLTSCGAAEERFLWALHPLLRLQRGDRLALPRATRASLNGEAWIDRVDSCVPRGGSAKLFVAPVVEGRAGIENQHTGDRLTFEWNPAENGILGLWLTRGGWHGHHHFAIEPTNGGADQLSQAVQQRQCGVVRAGGSATWSVALRLGP